MRRACLLLAAGASLLGCSIDAGGTADLRDFDDATTVEDTHSIDAGADVGSNDSATVDDSTMLDSAIDSTSIDSTVAETAPDVLADTIDAAPDAFEVGADATDAEVDPPCPPCPPLASCVGGACKCPTNSEVCVGKCLDLKADPDRCGSCDLGIPCALGSLCANGVCACQPGLTLCGGVCVDLKGHALACGTCTNSCGANRRCRNGACVDEGGTSCPSSRPDECPSGDGRKSCFDTKRDPMHCGGCGTDKRCASNEFCVDGSCKKYAIGVGCTSCPCANCASILTGSICCPAPPGAPAGRVVCVAASACPAWLPP